MRLALAVSALLLIAAPLHAQKTASKKAKQDTALVAKQQGANKSSKKASTKSATTKSASTKPDDSKKTTAKTASKANTKAASTKTDDARKTSTKAAAKPDAPKASAKPEAPKHETALGGGQFVGSKQGHTYYLASCKAAKALNAANRVEFGSEADAKKAGYTHSKQKGC